MKFLVTAGPTREAIDPVRFISNRSSGKMGYGIAEAAVCRGHSVVLISGPTALPQPTVTEFVPVVSTADMLAAVMQHLPRAHVLVMVAAVADWRPRIELQQKVKKGGRQTYQLELEPTEDILARVQSLKAGRLHVGFCAETGDPVQEGRRKLIEKGLDLVVANDVSKPGIGFESDMNEVTFLFRDGTARSTARTSKREIADALVGIIEGLSSASS